MRCGACHADNLATNRFCGECGVRLPETWPACDHRHAPGQKFCGECGAALLASTPAVPLLATASPDAYTPKHLAEKILRTRSAVEGERKQVTVMFADVSGFTAISERLDPEEVHAIMNRVFQVIISSVHRFEGSINQFLGDGVMALFGAPIAHEDHPHRALRAALAIQDGLSPVKQEIRETHGVKFRIRMGINTGSVFVGAIGEDLRMDYTAVGDTTNLAARLLSLAEPGQVLVSAQTHRLTDGFFEFEDLGEFEVKGKTEPVRVYGVTREIRGRTRLEVSKDRGLTPLVGRERELERLTEAYRRAARGEGAVILLTGHPGVGKSRLLYEFLHSLEDTGALELEATCLSYGASIPYHPISELFRRYLGLAEGTGGEEIRRRVAEGLALLGFEGDEPAILVAHFLGVSAPEAFLVRLAGAQLKERTFAVLREMLLRASAVQPVLLTVENVHWIDASSEEFLKHLAAALPGHRLFLLLSTRPDYKAAWLTPPMAETIAVEGLEGAGVRQMTQTLLGVKEVSAELLSLLVEKGEGNPLYVEEILRQLQETGGIVIESQEARLSRADVRVPATIHDIIAARIDRLADPVKHALQVASVVGRQVGVSLLARVLKTDGALTRHLDHLQAHDFLFLSTREPEPVYTFKHALTQEVAYTSLLARRRRVYHADVGRGLEDIHVGRIDEVVELLAHHFGRSAEDDKAVDYTILAAEKAQRRWANTEALAQFDAALKRLPRMPDTKPNRLRRIDAVVKGAEVMFALGRHAEQVETLEAIKELVDASADPQRRAAWYFWAGFLHSIIGTRPDVPIAYCREASAIAEASGLEELRAFAQCALTQAYNMVGNFRGTLDAGEQALAIFGTRGNVWWACRTLWALSVAAMYVGDWARSLEYCRRSLEHGREVNDLRLKVVGWWRTGWTHIQRGDAETGIRCCDEALALGPIPFDAVMAKAAKGYGLIKAGQVAAGTTLLADTVAWLDKSHLQLTRAQFALCLGDGYLRQGERARARAIVEEVLAIAREGGYRHHEGIAHRLLGEVLTPKDPTTATDHLEAALKILDEVGARNEFAKTLVAQAGLQHVLGDQAGARQRLERALTLFEELGTLDWPPRVREALAALTTPAGK